MTTPAPNRRTVLASALGLSALGGAALAADPASAALGEPQIPTAPDVAFLLSIDGIPGGSVVKGFEGQVELITWGWGVDAPYVPSSGGGGGAGKATPREFVALADTGIQSPTLLLNANTGRHIKSVQLSCVRKPRKPFTFLTIKLEDVVVTSYAITPDPTDGVPVDLLHLAFTKITQSVIPQNPDGTAGTPVTTSFDYARLTP